MGLVKRVPVYQAPMDSNPLKGNISRQKKGHLTQSAPHFQAPSGQSLLDTTGNKHPAKSKKGSRKGLIATKQKAGLSRQGYGI